MKKLYLKVTVNLDLEEKKKMREKINCFSLLVCDQTK